MVPTGGGGRLGHFVPGPLAVEETLKLEMSILSVSSNHSYRNQIMLNKFISVPAQQSVPFPTHNQLTMNFDNAEENGTECYRIYINKIIYGL